MPIKYRYNFKKMRPRLDLAIVYRKAGISLDGVKRIQQIQASEATIDLMEHIIRRGVMRKFARANPKFIGSVVSFHMLQWAPKINNDIPLNEVWVYPEEEFSTSNT